MNTQASLHEIAVTALENAKGIDVDSLDVRELSDFTDFMVIASGTSNRHVKALADRVRDELRDQGYKPLGVEGEEDAEWILLDYADIVVHVMQKTTRDFYDLESLWGEQVRDMLLAQREQAGE